MRAHPEHQLSAQPPLSRSLLSQSVCSVCPSSDSSLVTGFVVLGLAEDGLVLKIAEQGLQDIGVPTFGG